LHLAILIETMRREGYEFSISRPEVIFKDSPEGRTEPIETLYLEVHNDYFGAVSEMLGKRRAFMKDIRYGDDGTVYTEYLVPTRGMLGFRQPFLTATRGTGIFHTLFHGFEPYKGPIETQEHGSMISLETGTVSAYALQGLEARGIFFVVPSEEVYHGQVVGQYTRNEELVVNVCRTKVLSAMRVGPSAIVEALSTPRLMSLDESIEYLSDDELLEVTPTALRIRKKELRHELRQRTAKRAKKAKSS
jgi:GTP-binding protein